MSAPRLSDGRLTNKQSVLVPRERAEALWHKALELWPDCGAVILPETSLADEVEARWRVHYVRVEPVAVEATERRNAVAGQTWEVRVGGELVHVRLTRAFMKEPGVGYRVARPWWTGVNERTGRVVEGHRARLRVRVA